MQTFHGLPLCQNNVNIVKYRASKKCVVKCLMLAFVSVKVWGNFINCQITDDKCLSFSEQTMLRSTHISFAKKNSSFFRVCLARHDGFNFRKEIFYGGILFSNDYESADYRDMSKIPARISGTRG
jgi:hypothetical protein